MYFQESMYFHAIVVSQNEMLPIAINKQTKKNTTFVFAVGSAFVF